MPSWLCRGPISTISNVHNKGIINTNHDHWRLDTKSFFDDGLEVRHLIHDVESQGFCQIGTADTILLFTDLGEDVGMIDQVLETVDQTTTHSVLTGEQEREQNHAHLVVTEVPAALVVGVLEHRDPLVKHTGGELAVVHCDLAVLGSQSQPLERDFTGLYGFVDFRARNSEREVDKL